MVCFRVMFLALCTTTNVRYYRKSTVALEDLGKAGITRRACLMFDAA